MYNKYPFSKQTFNAQIVPSVNFLLTKSHWMWWHRAARRPTRNSSRFATPTRYSSMMSRGRPTMIRWVSSRCDRIQDIRLFSLPTATYFWRDSCIVLRCKQLHVCFFQYRYMKVSDLGLCLESPSWYLAEYPAFFRDRIFNLPCPARYRIPVFKIWRQIFKPLSSLITKF